MASTIQVVLKEDVENLGRSGELVRVRRGYARNYLIPRGIAAMATRSNISQIEHERKLALARAEKVRKELEVQAEQLSGLRIQIAKEADDGKLYGSVTSQEIAEALEMRGVNLDRRKLILPDEPIKMTGPYDIQYKLGSGVRATFRLDVTTRRA